MTPAQAKKMVKFGAKPLVTKPMTARIVPTKMTLRQPNLSTRSAESGPTQSTIPICVDATIEETVRPVAKDSMISLRKMPNG